MGRYTGPACRLCRREGIKLYLKAERCYSEKCALERKPYIPGQHGRGRRGKPSEYGSQLREKQKAKRIYGILERQFRNYFEKAERQPGITGENLLALLERRLDNVVYRLGFAGSRPEARQLITHGHFLLNGRKVNIPSILVKVGDVIQVKEKSMESAKFKELQAQAAYKTPPEWLEVNADNLSGRVLALPRRDQIDAPIDEHLIVELYSR
ncbi:MAG TPA: 30S ribosomal protein S4 [Syntrophothermus lipocalidus]|uniref:Small ribosomal subunit protein uS4 n=1 Tax=Syntrophothermus lipocalidus (strain DSM 12680 / TGB-C1) TaxID=643648 RepID=D7CJJ5_SYNLT|nr:MULTISPECIES: 30S ribosomal protein S4 [Syntrophothermus]ADI02950.1 ribosomal protein S4 [Syntrophothermus lipocalidus DSM 12680]NSW82667.1 30S ribosomal protein S4 [Syntrophothermus sp.]HHV77853.1 30S ribosomal protein S4 [Syntrophothermus lipocalidus]HOV42479.1 30S ribosomal protein S4 [Syntrophothermus lipocalidus]